MPYRCDFYSDDEYEYACQMEKEAYREQLAKEEAFAQYCEEEYRKETERTLCNMKDKIYVVEMSSDELGDMSIGYASSQAIANKMLATAESTEGFENCRFRAYQATLNQLEINDNTISFAEPKYREHPMTTEEIRANMDENDYCISRPKSLLAIVASNGGASYICTSFEEAASNGRDRNIVIIDDGDIFFTCKKNGVFETTACWVKEEFKEYPDLYDAVEAYLAQYLDDRWFVPEKDVSFVPHM